MFSCLFSFSIKWTYSFFIHVEILFYSKECDLVAHACVQQRFYIHSRIPLLSGWRNCPFYVNTNIGTHQMKYHRWDNPSLFFLCTYGSNERNHTQGKNVLRQHTRAPKWEDLVPLFGLYVRLLLRNVLFKYFYLIPLIVWNNARRTGHFLHCFQRLWIKKWGNTQCIDQRNE